MSLTTSQDNSSVLSRSFDASKLMFPESPGKMSNPLKESLSHIAEVSEVPDMKALRPGKIKRIGGVVDIYPLLWAKDSKGQCCPGVYLPDTIILREDHMESWYFMSNADGSIRKKKAFNLVEEKAIETFSTVPLNPQNIQVGTRKRSPHDVAGYLMKPNPEMKESSIMEYFTQSDLGDLFQYQRRAHGILQKFVESKGESNSIIRAIWSPQMCLLQKRTNIYKIHDRKIELSMRAATFDSLDHLSAPVPLVGDILLSRIRQLCQNIVNHIEDLCRHDFKVKNAEFYLKEDDYDQLWFLWCSSLIFQGSQSDTLGDPVGYLHPHGIRAENLMNSQLKVDTTFLCPNCLLSCENDRKYKISFQAVISYFEQQHERHVNEIETPMNTMTYPLSSSRRVIEGQEDLIVEFSPKHRDRSFDRGRLGHDGFATTETYKIAPALKRILPDMSAARYNQERTNSSFLQRQIYVCETCCLQMMDSALYLVRESMNEPGQKESTKLPSIRVQRIQKYMSRSVRPPPRPTRSKSFITKVNATKKQQQTLVEASR
eukprot:TRINITY_DN4309_c0_g1_i2.p1 TRINITY_DN4309_c0_g1~~TRINITY_DN4309_c0_g1_i2.p1  ORF type:complete len:543 (+),score=59.65 TRINITY_DN4309_c0_g1_i2:63-1691(+)